MARAEVSGKAEGEEGGAGPAPAWAPRAGRGAVVEEMNRKCFLSAAATTTTTAKRSLSLQMIPPAFDTGSHTSQPARRCFIEMAACVEFRGENNEVGFPLPFLQ